MLLLFVWYVFVMIFITDYLLGIRKKKPTLFLHFSLCRFSLQLKPLVLLSFGFNILPLQILITFNKRCLLLVHYIKFWYFILSSFQNLFTSLPSFPISFTSDMHNACAVSSQFVMLSRVAVTSWFLKLFLNLRYFSF